MILTFLLSCIQGSWSRSYLLYIPEEDMGLAASSVLILSHPERDKFNHPPHQKAYLIQPCLSCDHISFLWLVRVVSSIVGGRKMSYTWKGMLPSSAPRNLLHLRPEIENTTCSTSNNFLVWNKIDLVKFFLWSLFLLLVLFFFLKNINTWLLFAAEAKWKVAKACHRVLRHFPSAFFHQMLTATVNTSHFGCWLIIKFSIKVDTIHYNKCSYSTLREHRAWQWLDPCVSL